MKDCSHVRLVPASAASEFRLKLNDEHNNELNADANGLTVT